MKNILKSRRKLLRGAILDKEIDIETEWIFANIAQKKVDDLLKKLEENKKKTEEEKAKDKTDMDKIAKLVAENVKLGSIGTKTEKPSGELGGMASETRHYINSVDQFVKEREYFKFRLKAVERMIESGYMKHFKEILQTDEEIAFKGKTKK